MASQFSRYDVYIGAEENLEAQKQKLAGSKEREGGLSGHIEAFLKSNRSKKCMLVITDASTFYLIKSIVTY